jgi:ribosomal RNA assembly protein
MTTVLPSQTSELDYEIPKGSEKQGFDHWKILPIKPNDNPYPLLEENSFATLFPKYQEKYLQSIWPALKKAVQPHGINCELNLLEGSMLVSTTKSTFDPYIIVKARDLIKLLSRSVPVQQAVKILQDGVFCEIIKIGGLSCNKKKYLKRKQRLLGPNGSTMRALELVTKCFILLQGNTVSVMGDRKGLKAVRLVVEDCFKSIHPIYHIKILLIKKDLYKNPGLTHENWERFISTPIKKINQKNNTTNSCKKTTKNILQPLNRSIKMMQNLESGEYFSQ